MTEFDGDFSGLRALFINCTLKRSPELSNTQGLVDISAGIMEKHGVTVEIVRAIDHDIATGVWPDMREHGWATDDWPAIFETVLASDMARMFKAAGGVPAYGNIRSGWDARCRYDFANPEHR